MTIPADRQHYAPYIIFLFAVWIVLPGALEAGEKPLTKTVQVIGTAKIRTSNIANARERAISESLISAVDLVTLEIIPLKTLVQNFQITNKILFGNARTFVQNYKVLTETKFGSTYRVVVQATVSIASLEEQLSNAGIMLKGETLPRVLFFITEQNLDDVSPRYWWGDDLFFLKASSENAMAEVLREKGFSVIDPVSMAQTIALGTDLYGPNLNPQDAIHLGVQLEADVVIVGQSAVERTQNVMGSNIRSFRGTLSALALRTETGEELASTTQISVAVNINEYEGVREALIGTGTLAGKALAGQIVSNWQKSVLEPAMVNVIVEGTRNLANFVLFRRTLNDIKEVKGLKTQEMKPDTATIAIDYTGTPKKLAGALMLKSFESFGINITEVSENHLRIELVSNEGP